MKFKLSLLSFLVVTNLSYALNDVENTQTHNTVSQNTKDYTSTIGTAKDWQLTETEWNQYLNLMQGLSGHYYQNLSPPEVLGINGENSEELRHYAEIAAKIEHDKLERELRFNDAFHEAAARIYSTEPIIKPFDLRPFTPIPKN